MNTRNQTAPNDGSKDEGKFFTESQSLENLHISDSEFFDSETGKRLILDDQVSDRRHFMQGTDCTGCSSWTLCSHKNVSSISLQFSTFKQKQSVSVGEFIGIFSEATSFSNGQNRKKPFLNCITSTPIEKRKSISMSSLLDLNNLKSTSFLSVDTRRNESLLMSTPTSVKPLKFSTPKWAEKNSLSGDFHYFIGSTARKNIQRLKKEENLSHREETFSFNSLEIEKTVTTHSNGSIATGSDISTFALTNGSLTKSCCEQWSVEPQLVILDPHKGNRVRLINYSNNNLKFKTTFDSRMTHICPLSGTVPALEQIGLRILLSQYAKKKNETFEHDIKIVIGRNEKNIRVKFVKVEKPKVYGRERTYVLY